MKEVPDDKSRNPPRFLVIRCEQGMLPIFALAENGTCILWICDQTIGSSKDDTTRLCFTIDISIT